VTLHRRAGVPAVAAQPEIHGRPTHSLIPRILSRRLASRATGHHGYLISEPGPGTATGTNMGDDFRAYAPPTCLPSNGQATLHGTVNRFVDVAELSTGTSSLGEMSAMSPSRLLVCPLGVALAAGCGGRAVRTMAPGAGGAGTGLQTGNPSLPFGDTSVQISVHPRWQVPMRASRGAA
jgi:hypothetical protein